MAKRGDKPLTDSFVVTQEVIDRVYQLTANGLSKHDVAGCLGMNEATLTKLVKKYPAVRKALGDGRYFGLQNATSRLRNVIDQGNAAAIMFYLKTRWLWRERDKYGQADNLQTDKKQDKIDFISMTPVESARVYQSIMKGGK